MALLAAVLAGFAFSPFAPALQRRWSGWLVAVIPFSIFVYYLTLLPQIAEAPLQFQIDWVPTLGVSLAFYVDGLSVLMALLVSGIGTLIFLYGGAYLAGDHHVGRMYAYLLLFMASMLGVVTSGNLIAMFVFWELTGLSSYLLIGYKHKYEDSRNAALQALLVTGIGGLCLMAGIVLIGIAGGTTDIATLLSSGDTLRDSALYPAILILVGLGAFAKSAQFPFHFWLPGAMAAPTPVSAYLHSATMVKAGVFLLARLQPVLGDTAEWLLIVGGVGTVTMVMGAVISIYQTDLKKVLAYATISVLGTLVMLIGIGNKLAIEAMVVFLISHSFYKGALFMVAGAVDHNTGTRDVLILGGLRKYMPFITGAALLAGLSMAGIPFFFTFIGKELIYETTLELGADAALAGWLSPLLTGLAVLSNALMTGVVGIVALRPFWGAAKGDLPHHPHRAPVDMWLGPLTLGVAGLLFGTLPAGIGQALVSPAASAAYGTAVEVEFEFAYGLTHGLTPMLLLSILTIGLGVGIYFARNTLRRILPRFDPGPVIGPQRLYAVAVEELPHISDRITRGLQTGKLTHYMIMTILAVVATVGFTMLTRIGLPSITLPEQVPIYELLLCIMISAAAIVISIVTTSRLASIVALGVVGYGLALIFVMFGAPDLAMTQFAIETLTVILFMLVIFRLPLIQDFSSRAKRLRDAAIAAAGGLLMTGLVLVLVSRPAQSHLAEFFAEASYLLAEGENVVNVILVDFRGLDTFGEITVLSIAAVGVFALLGLHTRSQAKQTDRQDGLPGEEKKEMNS